MTRDKVDIPADGLLIHIQTAHCLGTDALLVSVPS